MNWNSLRRLNGTFSPSKQLVKCIVIWSIVVYILKTYGGYARWRSATWHASYFDRYLSNIETYPPKINIYCRERRDDRWVVTKWSLGNLLIICSNTSNPVDCCFTSREKTFYHQLSLLLFDWFFQILFSNDKSKSSSKIRISLSRKGPGGYSIFTSNCFSRDLSHNWNTPTMCKMSHKPKLKGWQRLIFFKRIPKARTATQTDVLWIGHTFLMMQTNRFDMDNSKRKHIIMGWAENQQDKSKRS